MLYKLSFALLFLISGCLAADECVVPKPLPSFNVSDLSGEWDIICDLPGSPLNGRKCWKKTFTDLGNGQFSYVIKGVDEITGEPSVESGLAQQVSPARFLLSPPSYGAHDITFIAIDPEKYAVELGCGSVNGKLLQLANVYIRKGVPQSDLRDPVMAVLNENGISPSLIHKIDQTNC